MKQITVIAVCLFMFGTCFAQKSHHSTSKGSSEAYFGKAEALKNGVWGTIKDLQGEPLADVEAMIYKLDTIIASGFSDASGRYTTNSCAAGKYTVKLVYPNSNKYIMVSGVEIKKGRVMLNLTTNPPMADSSVSYNELQPKKKMDKNNSGRR